MSQHDLTIDNQGFPAFRADLNNALQALGSTQSGTSAPSPTFANQLWYDTTNNQLKIRNEDNDAWITLLTLDQVADALSTITASTVNAGALAASGNVSFDGGTFVFNDSGADKDFRIEGDTNANLFFTDASTDRIGIGNSNPQALLHVTNNSNSYAGGILIGSAGVASGYISTTDNLYIKPNTSANTASGIVGIVDINDNTKIMLSSVNGTIGLGGANAASTGVGITFPATQSASSDVNTLDDYEEGTWTPSVGGNATYNAARYGIYTKIGNIVTCQFRMHIESIGTGSTTTMSGLPFTSGSTAVQSGCVGYYFGMAVNTIFLSFYAESNATTMLFTGRSSSGSSMDNAVGIFGNGCVVHGSITYRVA